MNPFLSINTTLTDIVLLLLFFFGLAFIFVLYQAYRNFGTSQKKVYIDVFNDSEDLGYITAYMVNGAIYTRRFFFKIDDSSRLPFRYEDFPVKSEKKIWFGLAKVPVLKAIRAVDGSIAPAFLDIAAGNYIIKNYAAVAYDRILQSELIWIGQLAAGFVNTPSSLAEAIITGIKENWIGLMGMLLSFGFIVLIGVSLQYKDALVTVSEKMKEVAEILAEVAKNQLNVTNSTNSNVIVEIGSKTGSK
jgi:hypothetical protein